MEAVADEGVHVGARDLWGTLLVAEAWPPFNTELLGLASDEFAEEASERARARR